MAKAGSNEHLYIGVDVGGTKIQASLIRESGAIINSHACATPRQATSDEILKAIETAITGLLETEGRSAQALAAIGIAVPGVVDPKKGLVVFTPNINFSGVKLVKHLEPIFGVDVVLGNDCNLGTLGEAWLGSARGTKSAVGILVGTGIGGGFVQDGKIWQGSRETAMEVGHMITQIGGPTCGCGNKGCWEALASRTAMERKIKEQIDRGKTTVLTEILEGDLSVIRSGALRQALEQKDEVVTAVVREVCEILGHGCVTIRHLIDPEAIVFGGGVMEACSEYMLPTIEKIVNADPLSGARQGGRILLSWLGDDAVVLGAVAFAQRKVGCNPFKKKYFVPAQYPKVSWERFGEVAVGGETYSNDIYIRVGGKVTKRKKNLAKKQYGTTHIIGPLELAKICKGGPQILFIGTGKTDQTELAEEAKQFLDQRAIEFQALPTPQAVEAYNKSELRKAALLQVSV